MKPRASSLLCRRCPGSLYPKFSLADHNHAHRIPPIVWEILYTWLKSLALKVIQYLYKPCVYTCSETWASVAYAIFMLEVSASHGGMCSCSNISGKPVKVRTVDSEKLCARQYTCTRLYGGGLFAAMDNLAFKIYVTSPVRAIINCLGISEPLGSAQQCTAIIVPWWPN